MFYGLPCINNTVDVCGMNNTISSGSTYSAGGVAAKAVASSGCGGPSSLRTFLRMATGRFGSLQFSPVPDHKFKTVLIHKGSATGAAASASTGYGAVPQLVVPRGSGPGQPTSMGGSPMDLSDATPPHRASMLLLAIAWPQRSYEQGLR